MIINCTFSGCQATSGYGGGIWINTTNHNLTFDHCTISGNTASLGGGFLYNQNSGKVIFKNNTTLENNVANSASLGGGAIYASGSGTIELYDTSVSGNSAFNGGAIYTAVTVNVYDTVFSGNSSNGGSGSAIHATGASGKVGIVTVFNSLFYGNESTVTDGSGSSMKGCTVFALQYSDVLLANCTLKGNIEHHESHGVVSPRNNTAHINLVSCTMSENLVSDGSTTSPGKDIARTTNLISVHNTIATGTLGTIKNVVREYSIFTLRKFTTNKDTYTDLSAFSLQTYDKGVYPLNSAYEDAYNGGMSVESLQNITYNDITLTNAQKALLAKDQKGNDRTGTIMGAYVLTTAPSE